VEKSGLLGSATVRIDDKGRLKIPNSFRVAISEAHGREVYVTSVTGESVRVYPMPEWFEFQRKVAEAPASHPALQKLLDRVSYYGQVTEFDPQGRLVIQPRLRESALISGEVIVLGKTRYLEVWNNDRFTAKLAREPLTGEDFKALAEFGL
jgi:MraZ protein